MVLIYIYLTGFFFAVVHLANEVYNESDKIYSLGFCIAYVLLRGDTYKYTLRSWLYFLWKR